MQTTALKFKTVEEYFSVLPLVKRKAMNEMRKTIRKAAPQAEELISYNMPAFSQHGILFYYAAWKDHIGFYGASSTLAEAFKEELSGYKPSKGAIQFPLSEPLPLALISQLVKYRVKENKENAEKRVAKSETK